MIKHAALLLILLVLQSPLAWAQKSFKQNSGRDSKPSYSNDSTTSLYDQHVPGVKKPARDFFMMQVGYFNWVRPDSIKVKPVGYVFNAFLCYDFPIKKSRFSFATGLGINTSVVYLNNQKLVNNDTGVYGSTAHFVSDTSNAKRYKFNTTYLQAPFELRYFSNTENRNRGFKVALGVQVGIFLGAHTKEVESVGGVNIKYKEDTKRFLAPWNFAATFRIGSGNVSWFGSYNITGVFKSTNGPAITPFSTGICLSGL